MSKLLSNLFRMAMLLAIGSSILTRASPTQAGTFIDRDGNFHQWEVLESHALSWNGTPYIPVGGMFVSSWLQDPKESSFSADERKLATIRRAGIKDLYLNTLWLRPPEVTQRLVDLFERFGFEYGLQFPTDLRTTEPGYFIRQDFSELEVPPDGTLAVPVKESLDASGSARRAIFIVTAAESGKALKTGRTLIQNSEVRVPLLAPGERVKVSIRENSISQDWIDENAGKAVSWISGLQLGPGARFLIDPIVNEYAVPRHFLPASETWRAWFKQWLVERYTHAINLAEAWGLSEQKIDFDGAVRLVPMLYATTSTGVGHAVDDVSLEPYSIRMEGSRLWLDVIEARDDFLRGRVNAAIGRIRAVNGLPIVMKRHHEATRVNISAEPGAGADGLGADTYGREEELLYFNTVSTASEVAQSKRPTWFIISEVGSTYWRDRYVGYASRSAMYQDLNVLISAGAKGIFVFGIGLRSSNGDNAWTTFDLLNDPVQLEWLATYRDLMGAQPTWLNERPRSLFSYPVQNTDLLSFSHSSLWAYGYSGSWQGERTHGKHLGSTTLAPIFTPRPGFHVKVDPVVRESPLLNRELSQLVASGAVIVPSEDAVGSSPSDGANYPGGVVSLPSYDVWHHEGGLELVAWTDSHGVNWIRCFASGASRRVRVSSRSGRAFTIETSARIDEGKSSGSLEVELGWIDGKWETLVLHNPVHGVNEAEFRQLIRAPQIPLVIKDLAREDAIFSVH